MPILSFPHRSLRAFGLAALMACGANACATDQPASAPQAWRDARQLVLVVTDGMVHEAPVVPGRNLGPVVEILSGLTPGQTAITSPNSLLKEGDRVNPIEASPPVKPM